MPDPIKCAVPGCDKSAKTRGLCYTHYWHSQNSKTNNPQRAEALNYILPSRQGKRPKKDDDSTPAVTVQAQRIDKAVRANAKEATIRIGAMTELAIALHVERIKLSDGFIFKNTESDKIVFLDDMGRLHDEDFAKLKAGR